MFISLPLLFHYTGWNLLTDDTDLEVKKKFSDVSLLDPHDNNLETDILYVADADTSATYFSMHPSPQTPVCILCTDASFTSDLFCSDQIHWILIEENTDVLSAFNILRKILHRFSSWDKEMDQIILNRENVDAMLSCCSDILPCHLLLWDASFNICGFSKNTNPPSEAVAAMEEKGFFLRETVENLIEKDLIAKFPDSESRFVPGNLLPSGQGALIHHYFRQGLRFYSVGIYGVDAYQDTQWLHDLTEYYFERLDLYLKRNAPAFQEHRFLYESFLISVLERQLTAPDTIREKASIFKIPARGKFQLYCIQFKDYKATLCRYLMETMPTCPLPVKYIQYNNMILMLQIREKNDTDPDETEKSWQERIIRLLKLNKAFCGISSVFTKLTELPSAYQQACSALQFGLTFHRNSENHLYFYQDFYIYHMLQSVKDTLPLESLYLKSFDVLMNEDLRKSANNVELLSIYLSNNQAVTATAKQMFMHRNSVIYRINRIEEILGVNLENHEDAFQVDFSLKILKYLAWNHKDYQKYCSLL